MELLNDLLQYIIPLVSIIIAFLIKKYLGKKIDDGKIESLLYFIVNIVTDIEQRNPEMKGIEKQILVVGKVFDQLPKKDVSKLEKTFKTVDVAVERAFQLSHLANPVFKALKKLIK
jgi:hypothetical protein